MKEWCIISSTASHLGLISFVKNKNCSLFLGVHISENILSKVFDNVKRMPHGNKGYDFICNKGFKIDVKSSCLHKNNTYTFTIKYNKTANYFLCIAFDNRKNLQPQHIWLIKNNDIIRNKKLKKFYILGIVNKPSKLKEFSKYELTNKLEKIIHCCNKLKNIKK